MFFKNMILEIDIEKTMNCLEIGFFLITHLWHKLRLVNFISLV